MNQRIKELAEQALKDSMVHDGVYRPEGYNNSVSKVFADKFAELIVRECAEVGSKFSMAHPADIRYQIKRHFGVEE